MKKAKTPALEKFKARILKAAFPAKDDGGENMDSEKKTLFDLLDPTLGAGAEITRTQTAHLERVMREIFKREVDNDDQDK